MALSPLDPAEAVGFVERHAVVLESARGPAPSLAEAVAGEPIRGSWWPHPRSHAIFEAISRVRGAPDVLVCRLVEGRVTYVHSRLWPALLRLRERFEPGRLDAVEEEHTPSGAHRVVAVPFLQRVPLAVVYAADRLEEAEAVSQLEAVAPFLLQ